MASFKPMARANTFAGASNAPQKEFSKLSVAQRAHSFAGLSSRELLHRRVVGSNFHTSWMPGNMAAAATKPADTNLEKATLAPEISPQVVVVVDAFSTGACLADEAQRRGYRIAHVTSLGDNTDALADMVPGHLRGGALKWACAPVGVDGAQATAADAADVAARLDAALQAVPGLGAGLGCVVAVMAGAETGVRLADHLVEAVAAAQARQRQAAGPPPVPELLGNGSAGSEARREKYEMGEKVRAGGVRAVKQLRVTLKPRPDAVRPGPDVDAFLNANWPMSTPAEVAAFRAVVKPIESAGSDGVTMCDSFADVHAAIGNLLGKVNGLGQINEGVLVQEFLAGTEYVIDGVSRNGSHKVVTVWRYDRRAVNGAGFVCHGMAILSPDAPEVPLLRTYAAQVLNALEFAHGPSHMEVKLLPDPNGSETLTPCLVEVGARCHGAEGFWMSIVDEVVGYRYPNQAALTLDAWLPRGAAPFAAFPSPGPPPLAAQGTIQFLMLHRGGTLRADGPCDGAALSALEALPSYRAHEIFVKAGAPVVATVDCFSWGGVVKLANVDGAQLDKDYAAIEQLCHEGLWAFADDK